jgi:sugar/nucleoside kinase (ribokinase family)
VPDSNLSGLFIGLATLDIVYSVEGIPARNSKTVAKRQELYAGGPASNAAATFSALGGSATLATMIGCHPLADAIRDDLVGCGVRILDLSAGIALEPSFSSIFVNGNTGERAVVSANAARLPIPPFDSSLIDDASAKILLVDGHLMDAACVASARARQLGMTTVLDGGSWKQGTERLLKSIDVAICSQDFRVPGTESEEQVIEYLRGIGVRRGAITRGGEAIHFWEDGLVSSLPIPETKVVDTSGAGDVFHGAFCYRYCDGAKLAESLLYAAEIASLKCRSFGTRDWMKDYATVSA